jgi:hypothetical protein
MAMRIEKNIATRNMKWWNFFKVVDGWVGGSKCGAMDC